MVGKHDNGRDGTKWETVHSVIRTPGRLAQQNVIHEIAGPTSYAKRMINESFVSAWRLIINEPMLKLIKKCSDTETNGQLQHNRWSVTFEELDAFIEFLYACGALVAKNLPIYSLWSNTWGITFFRDTMSRNRFRYILRFIRFDMKSSRSQLAGHKHIKLH